MFESLETRRMLASNPAPPIVINGTPGPDTILVTQSGNTITVKLNGQVQNYGTSYSMGATPTSGPVYVVPKIVINGLSGNDKIWGNGTVQKVMEVRGGSGDDSIRGGAMTDFLYGGAGVTSGLAELGYDTLDGGLGNDRLFAAAFGKSSIRGGAGNDTITGGGASDTVFAGAGNDSILGNDGDDALFGEDGHDTILGGWGRDSLSGGNGNDSLNGGTGHDTLFGSAGNDALFGYGGNDSLDGGTGNDWLDGGLDHDTINGGGGVDTFLGGAGNDRMTGGIHRDWMDGGTGNDRLDGAGNNDTLVGGAGNDTLIGGSGADWLAGDAGNDSLDGGTGRDTMAGAAGTDTLRASQADETLSGAERVEIAVDTQQHQNDAWSCGPNSAARLLRAYGINANYETLKAQAANSNIISDYGLGTPPPALEAVMDTYRSTKRQSGAGFDTVINLLAQGRPVVALIGWGSVDLPFPLPWNPFNFDTAPEKLHYVCLRGFDAAAQRIFYTDTNGQQKSFTYGEFQQKWNWPGDGIPYATLSGMGVKKNTILW
jgi:Ca2+-binding RTX toxin-like protein